MKGAKKNLDLFEHEWCRENKIKILYRDDEDYPQALFALENPPDKLFLMGEPIWKDNQLLAVVGSRSPETANLDWLDSALSHTLKNKKIIVVSGGARGVDQKAHSIALRNKMATIAFLPSGLNAPYPVEFGEWSQSILEAGGAVVSQFLPNELMHKSYFRKRNELIAAISNATLIVECRRRSGTLLTAKYALELGKPLLIMPTAPGRPGMGGLDLLYETPATLVRDGDDLLFSLNSIEKTSFRGRV